MQLLQGNNLCSLFLLVSWKLWTTGSYAEVKSPIFSFNQESHISAFQYIQQIAGMSLKL
jgi:hypothetical protein